jgi:hypothetical protein
VFYLYLKPVKSQVSFYIFYVSSSMENRRTKQVVSRLVEGLVMMRGGRWPGKV